MNTDKVMTPEEQKQSLRLSLKAKINASKIERMSKNARQNEMTKIQKQVQKEIGDNYDLNKVMEYISTQKR